MLGAVSSLSELTRLAALFSQPLTGWDEDALAALAGLSKLEVLQLRAVRDGSMHAAAVVALAGPLTQLTCLEVKVTMLDDRTPCVQVKSWREVSRCMASGKKDICVGVGYGWCMVLCAGGQKHAEWSQCLNMMLHVLGCLDIRLTWSR